MAKIEEQYWVLVAAGGYVGMTSNTDPAPAIHDKLSHPGVTKFNSEEAAEKYRKKYVPATWNVKLVRVVMKVSFETEAYL